MDWIERMNAAITYIENNLLEDPNPEEAAQKANSSTYHFQRMFSKEKENFNIGLIKLRQIF